MSDLECLDSMREFDKIGTNHCIKSYIYINISSSVTNIKYNILWWPGVPAVTPAVLYVRGALWTQAEGHTAACGAGAGEVRVS